MASRRISLSGDGSGAVENIGRDRGLRQVGLITATLAVGGIVGTAVVAVAAHATTTSSTSTTTSGSSSTGTGSTSSGSSGSVSSGSGSVPQAQSSGS